MSQLINDLLHEIIKLKKQLAQAEIDIQNAYYQGYRDASSTNE